MNRKSLGNTWPVVADWANMAVQFAGSRPFCERFGAAKFSNLLPVFLFGTE